MRKKIHIKSKMIRLEGQKMNVRGIGPYVKSVKQKNWLIVGIVLCQPKRNDSQLGNLGNL